MLLTASQLKLFYGDMEIFANVNVEVGEQARVGLVGPNGSGKTSLLRVLTGSLQPDGGNVSINPGLRSAYVSQMPEHDAPGTLRDEVQTAFQQLFDLEDELAASALEIQQRDGSARRQAETRYAQLLEEYEALGGMTTRTAWTASSRALECHWKRWKRRRRQPAAANARGPRSLARC